jgi:colanic acid/amylovoran biosynthesis protein
MRVTILNTYSWYNKGDAAIVLGTVQAIRQTRPDAQFTVVSMTPEIDRLPFAGHDIQVISGPFGFIYDDGPLAVRGAAFVVHAFALLLGVLLVRMRGIVPGGMLPARTRELVRSIAEADLIVSVGGGFWSDNARRALYIHLFQVVCALIARGRVVCLGVSLGPFRSRWRMRLVGKVLDRTVAVVLREEESLPVARAMGIGERRVHLGGDMAFGLAAAVGRVGARPTGRLRIGVTARSWIFPNSDDPRQAQAAYERILAAAIDGLIERYDADICFLPQVIGPAADDDRIVQRRIMGLLRHAEHATLLERDLTPVELVSVIGGLDMVLATRFHSAIFTMLAHVPVVAIAYEHKTTGIMDSMGLRRWAIPIEQISVEELLRLCAAIQDERDAVAQHLERAVADMHRRANTSAALCIPAEFGGRERALEHDHPVGPSIERLAAANVRER